MCQDSVFSYQIAENKYVHEQLFIHIILWHCLQENKKPNLIYLAESTCADSNCGLVQYCIVLRVFKSKNY